jgi:hypothetical protein
MNTSAWRTASAAVKLKPSDSVKVDSSMRYNFDTQKFEVFSGTADLSLPGNIKLGYEGQWDNTLQVFTKNDISLGYHQHCRTFKLVYRQSSKSFWLEYQLDAFPGNDVTVGASGSSGLILDVNGLDNLLK